MRRVLLLCCIALLAGPAGPASAAPAPEDVRIVQRVVPLPDGVKGVGTESCLWTREGKAIVCPFTLEGLGSQIGRIMPDGSGFTCLTCGHWTAGGRLGYLSLFADRQRFLFGALPAAGAADAGANVVPYVGECAPSLLDCQTLEIFEVALPQIPGNLNTREPRLSPDGRHLAWTIVRTDGFILLMGDLERTADGYAVSEPRVLNPAPKPQTADEWARRGSFNEAKSFDRGGKLVYSSTRDGGRNLENYRLDLRTGETERVTYNLEWDEDIQFDPTGTYAILGSARRMHNQLRASSLAGAPPFLDTAVIASVAPASLGSEEMRRHNLEKWLVTVDSERAGTDGVMLNDKRGGWASGASKTPWSPDGTRAVWGERGPEGATRLVVTRFPQLPKLAPVCLEPDQDPTCQTPVPTWAPLIGEYPPLPAGIYPIPGPGGGTATLVFGGTMLGPENRITYNGFTTDDGRILDGEVELRGISRGGMTQTIKSNLAISGAHTGSSVANVTAKGSRVCGIVETVLDGLRLRAQVGQWNPDCGFTTPEMCPNGADADATETGDCSHDGLPNRYRAKTWRCAAVRVRLPRPAGTAIRRAVARRAGKVVARARGANVRRIRVRPLATRRSKLRVTLTLAGGRQTTVTRAMAPCLKVGV